MDESSLEQELADLEVEVERYEQDEEIAHKRGDAIERALERTAQDVGVLEALLKSKRDVVEQAEAVERECGRLKTEASTLAEQLQLQVSALASERAVLTQLQRVGEDVSEAMAILDDRQTWLDRCVEQLSRIGNRLDVALKAFDSAESVAADWTETGEQSPDGGFREQGDDSLSAAQQGSRHGVAVERQPQEVTVPVSDFDLAHANKGLGNDAWVVVSPGMGVHASITKRQVRAAQQQSSPQELARTVVGFDATREPFRPRSGGGTVYDSPEAQKARLNWCQGLYSADYQGTCGLCAVQNVARMAGKKLSERDVVDLAFLNNLCERSSVAQPGERGGTSPEERQRLLSLLGIESVVDKDTSLEHIANMVESGRGVIASVEVGQFWKGALPFDQAGGHAVTITSVERDEAGLPVAFHLCDSGLHDANYMVGAHQFMMSLRPGRGINVTVPIIR